MFNYDEYKGYSLLEWCYNHLEDEVNGIVIMSQIRGQLVTLAICINIYDLIAFLGFSVLDSAVIECVGDTVNLFWLITIDLDKTGRKFKE